MAKEKKEKKVQCEVCETGAIIIQKDGKPQDITLSLMKFMGKRGVKLYAEKTFGKQAQKVIERMKTIELPKPKKFVQAQARLEQENAEKARAERKAYAEKVLAEHKAREEEALKQEAELLAKKEKVLSKK